MLIDIYRLKEAAGIELSDTSQDASLTALGDAASEVIELYLHRHLDSKERTETLYQWGECLRLKGFPVTDIESIKAAGVEITDYQLDAESGLIYREGGWPREALGYEVTYTGGIGTPCPAAIQQAVLMVALQLKATTGQGGMSAASERLGDYSITYMAPRGAAGTAAGLEALNPAAAALLRPYVGGTP